MPSETVYHSLSLAAQGTGEGRRRKHVILTAGTMPGKPLGGAESPTYTVADLEGFVSEFRGPAPVGIHHATYRGEVSGDPRWFSPELSAARGWIVGLEVDGDALVAEIDWTEEGASLIDEGKFRFFSVELGRSHAEAPVTVIGGTLTNDPFWDLPPLDELAASIEDYPIAVYAGGARGEPSNSRRPHNPNGKEDTTMPTKEELQEQVAALTKERDELKAQRTGDPDVAAMAKERDELAAKLARLERQAQADRERRYQADLDRALSDGLENTKEVLETARKRWDLSQETGEGYWDDFVAAHSTVRTTPTGGTGPDHSRHASPDTAQDAGALLHEQALSLMVENEDMDYTAAFARVKRDPKNAAIVAVYELPGSKEV